VSISHLYIMASYFILRWCWTQWIRVSHC